MWWANALSGIKVEKFFGLGKGVFGVEVSGLG